MDVADVEGVFDADDARLFGIGEVLHRERGLNGLAVGFHDDGDVRAIEEGGGEHIGVRGLEVDALVQAAGDDVGEADAVGVAVGFVGQVEHHDPGHARGLRLFDAGQEHAADDVGVHARARDILADLLDDQQVNALDEEAGH